MTAALLSTQRAGNGAPQALAFDAIAERAGIAETYSRTAADFAMVGDRRGVAYALRQAAIAISSAADAAATLQTPREGSAGSC